MTLRLPYAHRDQGDLEQDAKDRIRQQFPAWSDFLDSDIGWAVIRMVLGIMDHTEFYLDRQAAETYLSSAELRSSVVAIAKSLGYAIRDTSSATVTVEFTVSIAHATDILIPRDTVLTISGKPFVVDADTVLPANTVRTQTIARQGRRYTTRVVSQGDRWMQSRSRRISRMWWCRSMGPPGTGWTRLLVTR